MQNKDRRNKIKTQKNNYIAINKQNKTREIKNYRDKNKIQEEEI